MFGFGWLWTLLFGGGGQSTDDDGRAEIDPDGWARGPDGSGEPR
jgi:hypothetical protein